jgi:hypothetical protein
MLATVREHAVEQLRATGAERRMRDAHARYVVALADRCAPLLGGPRQLEVVARIDHERANLRAAVRHLISVGDADTTARIAWPLYLYWWLRGYVPEVRVWMQELIDRIPDRSARADAMAQFYVLWSRMWSSERAELVAGLDASAATLAAEGDTFGQSLAAATAGLARATSGPAEMPRAVELLETSAAEFHRLGVGWAEALCLVALGRLAWVRGEPETAMSILERANHATVAGGDVFVHSVTAHHVGRAHLFAGDLPASARFFRDAIGLSMSIQHDEGVAYGIEGLCAIAAARGDAVVAATLAGAAEAIRRRVTMFDIPAFVYHTEYLQRAAQDVDPDTVDRAMHRGAGLTVPELVDYALGNVRE